MAERIELLQGTLDLLILQVLQWGPQHGHGIGQAIRVRSQEVLQIEHGSLFRSLHRLEQQGWLVSGWKMSEAHRRARYYRLTPKGRRQLTEEQSRWKQLAEWRRSSAGAWRPPGPSCCPRGDHQPSPSRLSWAPWRASGPGSSSWPTWPWRAQHGAPVSHPWPSWGLSAPWFRYRGRLAPPGWSSFPFRD